MENVFFALKKLMVSLNEISALVIVKNWEKNPLLKNFSTPPEENEILKYHFNYFII